MSGSRLRSRSGHSIGLLLTGTGAFVLSPDGLVLRLLSVDVWTILLWRGLGMAAGLTFIYWLVWARGRLRQELRALGRPGILAGLLFATDNVLFITAITHSTVANTLLILSAGPLFAALFSRSILREPVPRRTWLAVIAVVTGVIVIFWGSLGEGRMVGNLAALGASLSIAGTFVVIRRSRATNMVPAMALGALLAALLALPLSSPATPRGLDVVLLLTAGLIMLPAAFSLITLGPRYLPAPEVSLLMLLETVLGPFWVWLVLQEVPSATTFVGGALVLTALTVHAVAGLRHSTSRSELGRDDARWP